MKNSFLALSLSACLAVAATGCGGSASKNLAAASTAPASSPAAPSDPSSPSAPASPTAPSSPASSPTSDGITVASPAGGSSVDSPFNLAATAASCSSQQVTSVGYSLDDSTDTQIVSGASLHTQVPAPTGTHVLHVKAWGSEGASCNADVTVAVANSYAPQKSLVPSSATSVNGLQTSNSWQAAHDPAAGSSSGGNMSMAGSPSLSGHARRFDTHFSGGGGEIYDVIFGSDPYASNFFYDAWVYLTGSTWNMSNLEMDMNQVLDNGQTVIYGFQCDAYSGTWDYTANTGSASHPHDTWIHSNASCNVQNWSKNAWHHVQISYSRDDSGHVTYHSVWLDGNQSTIEKTVYSAFSLGWTPALLTNFQVDGRGSGSNTVYLDKLTISRW